ncbi:MAG: hypothetical protein KC505_03735 [Myxococcales bacterium]|nr:hypothetical protein [Myxococcales bacterium]USN49966.1 MAG: hypothetical protein H6731_06730 [Myxococcales bacterium]
MCQFAFYFCLVAVFISPISRADFYCSADFYLEKRLKKKWNYQISHAQELTSEKHKEIKEIGPFVIVKDFDGDWVVKIYKVNSSIDSRIISAFRFNPLHEDIFQPVKMSTEEWELDIICKVEHEPKAANILRPKKTPRKKRSFRNSLIIAKDSFTTLEFKRLWK